MDKQANCLFSRIQRNKRAKVHLTLISHCQITLSPVFSFSNRVHSSLDKIYRRRPGGLEKKLTRNSPSARGRIGRKHLLSWQFQSETIPEWNQRKHDQKTRKTWNRSERTRSKERTSSWIAAGYGTYPRMGSRESDHSWETSRMVGMTYSNTVANRTNGEEEEAKVHGRGDSVCSLFNQCTVSSLAKWWFREGGRVRVPALYGRLNFSNDVTTWSGWFARRDG